MGEFNLTPLAKTDLGPTFKALVEKIADCAGVLWRPIDTVRQAEADAEAERIRLVGKVDAEFAELQRRAENRNAFEQARSQRNLEAVYGKAITMMEPEIDAENVNEVDEDWIFFHSDRAQKVSDAQMQTLWARIMAEQVKAPGSFSLRTLDFLSTLEKQEAHYFTAACRFVFNDDNGPFLAMPDGAPVLYEEAGLNEEILNHLDAIGLIKYPAPNPNYRTYDSSPIRIRYFGEEKVLHLSGPNPNFKKFVGVGKANFTKLGLELSRIAGSEPLAMLFRVMEAMWSPPGLRKPSEKP